jgi:hypothetical protein
MKYAGAPQVEIIGLGGTRSRGYEVDLKLVLKVANYSWNTKVVFCAAVDSFPFILLGHVGFFDHFDATFQTRLRHFHITKPGS